MADDSLDEAQCSTMAKNTFRCSSPSNGRSRQMKMLSKPSKAVSLFAIRKCNVEYDMSASQAAPITSSRPTVETFDDDTASSVEVAQEQQQQQASNDVQDKNTGWFGSRQRESRRKFLFHPNISDEVNLSIDDAPASSYEFLSKKCNKLLKENVSLQLECARLTREIHQLKRTTIRMFVLHQLNCHTCHDSRGIFTF